jgi:hypothetical protein
MIRDHELERFRQDIDLRRYALGQGYVQELDLRRAKGSGQDRHRRRTSRNSCWMHNPSTGDSIVISRAADGHWIYFTVGATSDKGDIIEFARRRLSLSLGRVRQELRPWIGEHSRQAQYPLSPVATTALPSLAPQIHDRSLAVAAFETARVAQDNPYLRSRGVRLDLLRSPRFSGTWLVDSRGNTIFPHYDEQGLAGFEVKNQRFTGYAKGGEKALWTSAEFPTDTALVFTESGIEALSHAQLFPRPHARYCSVAGGLSPHQLLSVIPAAIARLPLGGHVVAGFNADPAGDKLTQQLKELVPPGYQFFHHRPDLTIGKDWNDALKVRSVKRELQAVSR